MTVSPVDIATAVLVRLEWVILVYFLVVNTLYAALLVSSLLELRRHDHESSATDGPDHRSPKPAGRRVLDSPFGPSISLLAPAYNEAATIESSVRALLTLNYPNLETVIVNDGSKDGTMDVLRERFELSPIHTVIWRRVDTQPVTALYRSHRYPNLIVVDKLNGGKADALNAGLNVASGDLVCALDADTLIEPDALQRMVGPFIGDDRVLAVGGTVRVANASAIKWGRIVRCRVPRWGLGGFQVVEYLRAFLFGRLGWNRLGGNLIISGAFGLFRRDPVVAAGGYQHDTVGEDMELVMRLRRRGYESGGPHAVEFIPDPVAWTEGPETLRFLGRQRDRWHRGLADALWRHRALLFNPRYGLMGLLVYPYFLFVELLAPVVEAIGLLGLVIGILISAVNLPFAILFFLVAYGYAVILTTLTLLMEEVNFHRYEGVGNRVALVIWMLLEQLGYRQLTVIWRLHGLTKYLRGRGDWGTMERRGFRQVTKPPS